MMNKFIGGLSVAALVGLAWIAPASAAGGGWSGSGFAGGVHGGGLSAGMHGGRFSGGTRGEATFGGPSGGFDRGLGPERPRAHDWDHDHHHHHHDHDDGFLFLDDPYFYDDDGYAIEYAQTPADDGYWYYCADSKSYYPQVRDCASGWERVSSTPP